VDSIRLGCPSAAWRSGSGRGKAAAVRPVAAPGELTQALVTRRAGTCQARAGFKPTTAAVHHRTRGLAGKAADGAACRRSLHPLKLQGLRAPARERRLGVGKRASRSSAGAGQDRLQTRKPAGATGRSAAGDRLGSPTASPQGPLDAARTAAGPGEQLD